MNIYHAEHVLQSTDLRDLRRVCYGWQEAREGTEFLFRQFQWHGQFCRQVQEQVTEEGPQPDTTQASYSTKGLQAWGEEVSVKV